jgi:hypothetical protein
MNSARRMRSMAAAILIMALALWSDTAAAIPPAMVHGASCNAAMSHAHDHATGKTEHDCCPSHAKHVLVSHDWTERPGCCNLSNQPERPLAFLIVSTRPLSLEPSRQVQPLSNPVSPEHFGPSRSSCPPIVLAVFDKKTDLRI